MRTAYISFSVRTVPEYEKFLPTPKAPSNYKDQTKIVEYVASQKAKLLSEATEKPLTAVLASVYVLASTAVDKSPKPVVLAWPDEPIATYLLNYERIAVLNYSEFIRLARIDWIERKGALTTEMQWLAFSEFGHRGPGKAPFIFDPIARLVDSTSDENTDPYLVAKRFLHVDDLEFNKRYTGLEGLARLTVDVSELLGV